jgi:hypothetical protein
MKAIHIHHIITVKVETIVFISTNGKIHLIKFNFKGQNKKLNKLELEGISSLR